MDFFEQPRKWRLEIDQMYFWTSTIVEWKNLLEDDVFKQIIISSLENLTKRELVTIYAFVIMPNHIHLIWKMNRMNGGEYPSGSFSKFTSHRFKKTLDGSGRRILSQYRSKMKDRSFMFWQRDPLAILLDSKGKCEQKLEYIHLNPLQEKWCLVNYPEDYYWSSASFYERNNTTFSFLTRYEDYFG